MYFLKFNHQYFSLSKSGVYVFIKEVFDLFLESVVTCNRFNCIDRNSSIMKKLAKRNFKGIDYIRLNALPRAQADALRKSLSSRTLIKIQMYDEVFDDCVLYETYEKWHKNYQEEAALQNAEPSINKSVSLT